MSVSMASEVITPPLEIIADCPYGNFYSPQFGQVDHVRRALSAATLLCRVIGDQYLKICLEAIGQLE